MRPTTMQMRAMSRYTLIDAAIFFRVTQRISELLGIERWYRLVGGGEGRSALGLPRRITDDA